MLRGEVSHPAVHGVLRVLAGTGLVRRIHLCPACSTARRS